MAERKGATVSQLAINWVKRQGLVVLFGARNDDKVSENLEGLSGNVELTDAEFAELEEARLKLKVKGTKNVFMTD